MSDFSVSEEIIDNLRAKVGEQEREITRLNAQVTELQAKGTALVKQRQERDTAWGPRELRQRVMFHWVARVFGIHMAVSPWERALRVAEEALELAQAATVERETIIRLVDRVFGREKGIIRQEIGGLLITILAFSETMGIDSEQCERDELERVLSLPQERLIASQMLKHEQGVGYRP